MILIQYNTMNLSLALEEGIPFLYAPNIRILHIITLLPLTSVPDLTGPINQLVSNLYCSNYLFPSFIPLDRRVLLVILCFGIGLNIFHILYQEDLSIT